MRRDEQFIYLVSRFNKLPAAQLEQVIRELYSEDPTAAKFLLNTLVAVGNEQIGAVKS